jgi:nucleotide-binding universal stress UspA family protein
VLVPEDPTGASTAVERTRLHLQEQDLAGHAKEIAGDRGRALVVIDDDPAAAIVEAAEAEQIDVIVVGNAGMTGRKEFLLGNVPNRVSHNARCTVVIVNSSLPSPAQGDESRGLFRRKR